MATAAKNLSTYTLDGIQISKGARIGIVVSEWNEEITSALLSAAKEVLKEKLPDAELHIHHVPGSFELAQGAQWLFERL